MGYQPMDDYGIVGDLHSVALVGIDGSIDWLRFPERLRRRSRQREGWAVQDRPGKRRRHPQTDVLAGHKRVDHSRPQAIFTTLLNAFKIAYENARSQKVYRKGGDGRDRAAKGASSARS